MKTISKRLFDFIRNHKFWSIAIFLIAILIVWFLIKNGSNNTIYTQVSVTRGSLSEIVSVTGNVKPFSDVDLAFERGGRVASVNVAVGDQVYAGQILASVSNADLVANLNQAKANLKKVRASLGDNAEQTNLSYSQAENSLINTIKDSYTKADDAVRNKIFSLFNDPVKYRARLAFSTNTFLQEEIEEGKDESIDSLEIWYRSLSELNNLSDFDFYYNKAKTNLISVKVLLDKCAEAVNGLSSESSDSTQTQIDTWKLNISTARTSINTAIDTLVTSFNQYKTAGLSVEISENSTLAEEAAVEQAEAGVAQAEAELAKTFIYSPIGGLITKVDIKLGEIVSANFNIISVISATDYQVESFIPEADIAKIKIGNIAKTTLDAYSDRVVFETKVLKIEPAATLIDGVPTYKVILGFSTQDDRIKSGLTANLDILTAVREQVLIIPTRAVYAKNGDRYVKTLNSNNTTKEIKIETGLRGSDGKIEIISGLNEGDSVLTSL